LFPQFSQKKKLPFFFTLCHNMVDATLQSHEAPLPQAQTPLAHPCDRSRSSHRPALCVACDKILREILADKD
jgi:hypothetical protein